MNYSPELRHRIAKIMAAAKPVLWDGCAAAKHNKHDAICFALEMIRHQDLHAAVLARNIIMERLGNTASVVTWLFFEAKVPEHLLSERNVQQYRHRWLDALIAEFSA